LTYLEPKNVVPELFSDHVDCYKSEVGAASCSRNKQNSYIEE